MKKHILTLCCTFFSIFLAGADSSKQENFKLNPFAPFWNTNQQKVRGAGTLETFRPQQLQLRGLIRLEPQKDIYILVELPSGKSALLSPTSLIGPYQGKITEIREQSISILEEVPNLLGQVEKKLTILTFSRPGGIHE